MARRLTMRERRIPDSERDGYARAIPVRAQQARAAGAHFWVFEHAGDRGRFVEFVEAASNEALTAALEAIGTGDTDFTTGDRWTEFQGV